MVKVASLLTIAFRPDHDDSGGGGGDKDIQRAGLSVLHVDRADAGRHDGLHFPDLEVHSTDMDDHNSIENSDERTI